MLSLQTQITIDLLPISSIVPHPLNPRPWSELYQARVHEDKVLSLMGSIEAHGFDPKEAIQVLLLLSGKYLIAIGHHRFCAARELGHTTIPATLLEDVSELELALMLVSRQGKGVDPWCAAEHAYYLCTDRQMAQKEYVRATGFSSGLVSKWVGAYRVKLELNMPQTDLGMSAAAAIGRLPSSDWAWVVKLMEKHSWSCSRVERVVKNLGELANLAIPDLVGSQGKWLNPDALKYQVAIDESDTAVAEIAALVDAEVAARLRILDLPASIPNHVTGEIYQPLSVYTAGLLALETPTPLQIKELSAAVVTRSKIVLGEIEAPPRLWEPINLSDPSADDWSNLAVDAIVLSGSFPNLAGGVGALNLNGNLIIFTDPLESFAVYIDWIDRGFILKERLIWHRPNSPTPQTDDAFRQTCTDILIFTRSNAAYFGYHELREMPRLNRQTANCIQLPSSGDRLPPLLINLILAAYVPLHGSLFVPDINNSEYVTAAMKLGRIIYWSAAPEDEPEILTSISLFNPLTTPQ